MDPGVGVILAVVGVFFYGTLFAFVYRWRKARKLEQKPLADALGLSLSSWSGGVEIEGELDGIPLKIRLPNGADRAHLLIERSALGPADALPLTRVWHRSQAPAEGLESGDARFDAEVSVLGAAPLLDAATLDEGGRALLRQTLVHAPALDLRAEAIKVTMPEPVNEGIIRRALAAIRALTQRSWPTPDTAADRLASRVEEEPEAVARLRALDILRLEAPRTAALDRALDRARRDADPRVSFLAHVYSDVAPDTAMAVRMLGAPEEEFVLPALEVLAKIGGRDALDPVKRVMGDIQRSAEVRRAAMLALQQLLERFGIEGGGLSLSVSEAREGALSEAD